MRDAGGRLVVDDRRNVLGRRRERPYPVHPWAAEAAKLLPHFLLLGLLGLVWHNFASRGLPIYPSLQTMAEALALDPRSLLWAAPLALGFLASVVGHYLETYRYGARKRAAVGTQLGVDVTLTSVFSRPESVLPGVKPGRWWDPWPWTRVGWLLRVWGLTGAAVAPLLVLLWFFLVPVPGLIVMTAGEHRFGVQSGTVAAVAGALLGLVLAAAAFGWLGEWLANRRLRGGGLHAALAAALRRELSEAPAADSAEASARRRALLTDALTYHDQRAAAFAARCLHDARPHG